VVVVVTIFPQCSSGLYQQLLNPPHLTAGQGMLYLSIAK
jgi:hypothetical protein